MSRPHTQLRHGGFRDAVEGQKVLLFWPFESSRNSEPSHMCLRYTALDHLFVLQHGFRREDFAFKPLLIPLRLLNS